MDVCRTQNEFSELTGQSAADRYDAVLLDVNLTNDFFTDTPCDPEKGGFWLYNKLVRQGFPSYRIALLTAYDTTDDTTKFQSDCERFGHEKLEAHPKTGDQAGQWVKKLSDADDRYLILRRSVLDGIDFCESLLRDHGGDAIRFNRYVTDDEQRWSYDHALEFLCSLKHVLHARVPSSEIHYQSYGIVYSLGRTWDKANPDRGSDRYYKALGRVMRLLRNMASHGHMLDKASVRDLAFYVLAGMRSCFLEPGQNWAEPEPYERRLISLMGTPTPLEPDNAAPYLAKSYSTARSKLKAAAEGKAESTTRKDKKGKPLPVKDQDRFHKICNELASAKQHPRFDFIVASKEAFVHEAISNDWDDGVFNNGENELTDEYKSSLQELNIPPWVRAVWERIIPSRATR